MKHDELEVTYKKYYQSLFLFAFSLTRNKEDAEDLVANVFVKALLSYHSGNLKAWLYTVLKNEYYNYYKKRKKILDKGEMTLTMISDTTDVLKDVIHQEEKQWLYKQIYTFKQRDREVMLLSIQNDLNDQQIGKILHISSQHVRVIRNRVKKKLIELCQKEGFL